MAMKLALADAELAIEKMDYINAHGTATLLNDRMETAVIKNVFGDRAYDIPISASKSMLGHLLGAAGSIEAVVTVLAMNTGKIPPTINLTHPDPECDLDCLPNESRKMTVGAALNNSFGFGGTNASILLRKPT